MIDFRDLLQALHKSSRITQLYVRKSQKDLYYAICIGGAVSLDGLTGLIANSFVPGYGLPIAISAGVFLIPSAAFIANNLWMRRIKSRLGKLVVDKYVQSYELIRDEKLRELADIQSSLLPQADKDKQTLEAILYYQTKARTLAENYRTKLTKPGP